MVDRPATEKLVENAYTGTVHQAYQFLQAVEMNRQQPLDDHCIGKFSGFGFFFVLFCTLTHFAFLAYLAKYITQAWEPTDDVALLDELVSLMHGLPVRVPAYCPGLTLLLAIYYIDRLKQAR